jgi:hypothetical protein
MAAPIGRLSWEKSGYGSIQVIEELPNRLIQVIANDGRTVQHF